MKGIKTANYASPVPPAGGGRAAPQGVSRHTHVMIRSDGQSLSEIHTTESAVVSIDTWIVEV